MSDPCFRLEFDVRDYECDIEGIVNNAVYQNYLEHTRHVFLKSRGLDFATMTREGVQLVVVRAELDYRYPLRSGDRFVVTLQTERASPLRLIALQSIRRLPDDKAILDARLTITTVNGQGRPIRFDQIDRVLPGGASE